MVIRFHSLLSFLSFFPSHVVHSLYLSCFVFMFFPFHFTQATRQ
jgi:hypothetical protein